jgi:hypothetical protein
MGYVESQIMWELDHEEALVDLVEFVQDESATASKVA